MDLKNEIEKWLSDENLLDDVKMDPNSNFHFTVEYPKGNIMDVIQPKGKNDLLIIGCATNVSPEHVQLMQKDTDATREEFLWDIKFGLNNFLLNFDLNIEYNLLRGFVISDELYADGITKHNVIKLIQRIFKAKLNCVWQIEKTFGPVSQKNFKPHNENSMFV